MTPRRLAVKALMHQEQAGYANLVLDAELKKCAPPLDGRDAAFAARIFYTTLERLPLLDYILNQFTKKPVTKLDAPVRAVLRAGLAQAHITGRAVVVGKVRVQVVGHVFAFDFHIRYLSFKTSLICSWYRAVAAVAVVISPALLTVRLSTS